MVAHKAGLTVFVEVKTRSSRKFGWPEEAVTKRKQIALQEAVEAYLLMHPELVGEWRIDVIAVEGRLGDHTPVITHFENAVY